MLLRPVLRQSAPENGCQFHEKMVIDPVHAVTGIRDDGQRISSRSMAQVRPWKGSSVEAGIWRSANRRLMIMSGADVAIKQRAGGREVVGRQN